VGGTCLCWLDVANTTSGPCPTVRLGSYCTSDSQCSNNIPSSYCYTRGTLYEPMCTCTAGYQPLNTVLCGVPDIPDPTSSTCYLDSQCAAQHVTSYCVNGYCRCRNPVSNDTFWLSTCPVVTLNSPCRSRSYCSLYVSNSTCRTLEDRSTVCSCTDGYQQIGDACTIQDSDQTVTSSVPTSSSPVGAPGSITTSSQSSSFWFSSWLSSTIGGVSYRGLLIFSIGGALIVAVTCVTIICIVSCIMTKNSKKKLKERKAALEAEKLAALQKEISREITTGKPFIISEQIDEREQQAVGETVVENNNRGLRVAEIERDVFLEDAEYQREDGEPTEGVSNFVYVPDVGEKLSDEDGGASDRRSSTTRWRYYDGVEDQQVHYDGEYVGRDNRLEAINRHTRSVGRRSVEGLE